MRSKKFGRFNKIFAAGENRIFDKKPKAATLKIVEMLSNLDLISTQQGKEMNTSVESLKALTPFIRYYQFLGILPISILQNQTGLRIRTPNPFWVCSFISLFIQTVMLTKGIYEFIESLVLVDSQSATEKVGKVKSVIYFSHVLLMTIIMIRNTKHLPHLIETCKKVEIMCKKYHQGNDKLVKHCWILFGYFLSTQLFGNFLYYYSESANNNVTTPAEFSKTFSIDKGVVDSLGINVYLSIFEFYCDCGWLFGDMLTTLVSFILTRYFSRLNSGIFYCKVQTVEEIEDLRKDHRAMKDLVEECNQVFSPIILVNFIGNIGYLLTRLYTGLSKDIASPKLIVQVESIYALMYQITKIFIPTWFAAILNETAHVSLDTVHDWPSMVELPECRHRIMVISRFVSQLVNDPIGLSGCGYFTITKSFMVTLISGLMTYQVIIMQFQQSGI